MIFKCGTRPGRDWEYHAFSLETDLRMLRDLNKISRFSEVSKPSLDWESHPLVRNSHGNSDHKLLKYDKFVKVSSSSLLGLKTERTRLSESHLISNLGNRKSPLKFSILIMYREQLKLYHHKGVGWGKYMTHIFNSFSQLF